MDAEPAETAVAEPGETGTGTAPEETDWAAYYRYTLGREPRPLFTRGLAAMAAAGVTPGTAVDVGFGDGTETMALLEAGWRVTAIDSAQAAAEVLEPRVPESARDRLTLLTAPAADVELPPIDLFYSAYVLSYLPQDAFARLWARVRAALRAGGFIVVNIFGDRHEWAAEPDTTFLPRAEVERLLEGLEIVALDEVEEDGSSFVGPTHWHVFDIVARRPA
jgi:cyclopropane fatty-acyl-phospholipid synthase-like methyltransferase